MENTIEINALDLSIKQVNDAFISDVVSLAMGGCSTSTSTSCGCTSTTTSTSCGGRAEQAAPGNQTGG